MQWSEFQPYVLPYVIGCPYPVMEHHARLATIEFCRRTGCLTRTLDAELTSGTSHTIDLLPDAGTQVLKVKSVQVGGRPWGLVTAEHGMELANAGRLDDFAFASGLTTIEVHPLQAAGVPVVVHAALAPAMASSTCPDEVSPYLQDIASGVIASLMLIPAQPFSDPAHAQVMQSSFLARAASVASKTARGMSSAKMRSQATYL